MTDEARDSTDSGPTRDRRGTASRLRVLLPLLFGVPCCLAAGWFELTRALGGREIAWVYAFEWPLYAVVGVYMWWRIWHHTPGDERAGATAGTDGARSRRLSGTAKGRGAVASDDPDLRAWQAYLERLQTIDPPGGPPPR
jgi:hypothetical protein